MRSLAFWLVVWGSLFGLAYACQQKPPLPPPPIRCARCPTVIRGATQEMGEEDQPRGVTRRYYWTTSLDSLAAGRYHHTHVQVTGTVAYVAPERDGDTHIKLVSLNGAFIIAECIPAMPCRLPTAGQKITVRGISRWDPVHHWYEVHPVESWN